MAESQLPPETPAMNQPAQEQPVGQSGVPGNQEFLLPNQPEPEYLLLEWLADSRLAQKRSKEYYSSLAVIVLLLSLILFFANQVLLIFVLISFLFVTYVLASVKPDVVHNVITSYGIRYRDQLFYWEQLGRFWVSSHQGNQQIHIEAPAFMSSQIILLPSNAQSPLLVTTEDIVGLLSRYLPYEEPSPTQIDRWVEWLNEKFPLESKKTSPKDAGGVTAVPQQPQQNSPMVTDKVNTAPVQDTSVEQPHSSATPPTESVKR